MATVCNACKHHGKGYDYTPCRCCTRNPLHCDNFAHVRNWTKEDYEIAKAFVNACHDGIPFFERTDTRVSSGGTTVHGDFLKWGVQGCAMDSDYLCMPFRFMQLIKTGECVLATEIISEYESVHCEEED